MDNEGLLKIIKEDWEAAEKEVLSGKKSLKKWQKVFIILGGILSVLLLLSYVLVSWPVGDIVAGKLVSSVIDEDFFINADGIVVEFDEGALKELQEKFIQNEGQEFTVCLLGNVDDNNFMINEIFQPKILDQSFSHVRSEPCPPEALIHLHSHPHKRCIPSEQDMLSFQQFKLSRENALMIVMCEKERFTVVE